MTKKKKKEQLKSYQTKAWLEKNYPKKSAGAIAKEQNVSRGVILRYLRKFDIPVTTRVSPKTGPAHFKEDANRSYRNKEWLKKQLDKGLTVNKIATDCKVGYMQVKHYCEKFGLLELVQQQRAKAKTEKKPAKKKEQPDTIKQVVKKVKKVKKALENK